MPSLIGRYIEVLHNKARPSEITALTRLLGDEGAMVFSSARDAHAYLRQPASEDLLDVILMDADLGDDRPVAEAERLLKGVRQRETCPVIALTSRLEDEAGLRSVGFADIVAKPVNRDSIILAILGVVPAR